MKLNKLTQTAILSGALFSAPFAHQLHAGADTSDILIDVLVRKGILTEEEALEIRQEVEMVAAAAEAEIVENAVAAATQEAKATVASAAPANAVPMPKALDNLKLYGDARFRFQGEDVDDNDTRLRWRYRARFGAEYGFAESPFSLGVRVESGSANDSTNNNFGGFFDKVGDELFLGLVYLNYEGENMEISLGKHKHPFTIDGAFWDGDINPEGISESFDFGSWKLNLGQYIIDEEREDKAGSGDDDFLFAAQAEWSNGEGLTVAPIFFATTDGESYVSESATFKGENAIKYFRNFHVLAVPVEYSFKGENGIGQKLYGTVGMNFSADDAVADVDSPFYSANAGDEDTFFNFGYQYGSAKKAGTWQAGLEYRHIEGASFTPNLTDSDFGKNSMNHAGFVLSYKYAVTDFFTAGLTYMDSDTIDDAYDAAVVAKDDVKLLQIDAAVKF
ncbi:putative porin [Pelagicoccus sp. SDUM812003]|uniref:putative porin n=1 Tax=Pelagicoccus sp. SDUM812003 TaxID=3041267 RepID=UPI00280F2E90|nr:putative porin [Pelagicoccus sp. SDUM812003]MDQ8203933.1 putative porin [Pelagicoccus sp. SDUM812003]